MLNFIEGVVTWTDRFLKAVISAMVGVMLLTIVLQVFCRYVLNSALGWPEELSRYLMIWSGLLAAIYAYHEGSHVGVTFLLERLHPKAMKVIVAVSHILVGVFLCVVTWQGTAVLGKFMDLKSSALQIPMVAVYAAVPVSSFLMLLVCFKLIYVTLFDHERSEE
jgi:TRAP-type transport system small permease protein